MLAAVVRRLSDLFATSSATLADDEGQGLAEYGLILGFIAIVCIAAVGFLGVSTKGMLNNIGSGI